MSLVHATRWAHTPFGAFGHWILPEGRLLYTCEDRWRNNQNNISCIPPGPADPPIIYEIERDRTGRFQYYRFINVDGRDNIEVHNGNEEDNTEGCVLIGTGLGLLNDKWAVTNSKKALEILVNSLGEGKHQVLLSWSFK